VVLGLAVLFLLQPVEWFHYAAGAIDPAYRAPDLGVGALFGEAIAYTQQGDFLHFVRNNLLTGQKASLFWAIDAGRYIQTAGLFLLGFYFGSSVRRCAGRPPGGGTLRTGGRAARTTRRART